MKQLRYWLREKSFVTFVVGGVLLLILTGSTVYLIKSKSAPLVAVVNSDESSQQDEVPTELPGANQSSADDESSSSTVSNDPESGTAQVVSADELPRTGSGPDVARWSLVLMTVYGVSYAGHYLVRRA